MEKILLVIQRQMLGGVKLAVVRRIILNDNIKKKSFIFSIWSATNIFL